LFETPGALREIYNSKKTNPKDHISAGSAYKVVKEGFVKATCRTDCCGICEGDGKMHTAAEFAAHEEHMKLAVLQRM
jgi:hypothetical protein